MVIVGPEGALIKTKDGKVTIDVDPSSIELKTSNASIITNDDSIDIKAQTNINLDAPNTIVKGNMQLGSTLTSLPDSSGGTSKLKGTLETTDDVIANGISLVNHPHDVSGVETGSSTITTSKSKE